MNPAWDQNEFNSNFSGLEEFGIETIQNFIQIVPSLVGNIEAAIAKKDAKAVENSAHVLMGAVSTFYAEPSRLLAYKIEQIGHSGNLEPAPEALIELQMELKHLLPSLETFIKQRKSS